MRVLGAAFSILFVFSACASDDDATDDVTDDPVVAATLDPNSPDIVARVAISVERGVDRASALGTHEARVLKNDHGVKWTGVYIGDACNGGSSSTRATSTSTASAMSDDGNLTLSRDGSVVWGIGVRHNLYALCG